jgi:hypothetical protein
LSWGVKLSSLLAHENIITLVVMIKVNLINFVQFFMSRFFCCWKKLTIKKEILKHQSFVK